MLWGNPDLKEYILYFSIYIKSKRAKLSHDVRSQDSGYLWTGSGSGDQKGQQLRLLESCSWSVSSSGWCGYKGVFTL